MSLLVRGMQTRVPPSTVRSLVVVVTVMYEAVQKLRSTRVLSAKLMTNQNLMKMQVCVTISVITVVMSMAQVRVWEHGMVRTMELLQVL